MSKHVDGIHAPARREANTGRCRPGKVYLVGAGPGDPELLTLKAARLLAGARVVVYDHLVGDGILGLIDPSARMIYAGKEAGHHALPQDRINDLLVELARGGDDVVRLKGGDPFLFGRGGEEMEELFAAGIECEVVPGITAACGISACTGMPLTHRDHARSVVFTTGHLKDGTVNLDWTALARPNQTVVIYMGLGALDIICSQLIVHGLAGDTPAAVVHKGTTAEQIVVTERLDRLPGAVKRARLKSPALIMIGSVISLHALQEGAAPLERLAMTA
ncbi:MAG: uroporphyrinogen-III C-methyltransferase [Aromatoleum sp.]|jgi:uroporphyrin-III C-methyltransferase|uniref:uroporphyrinogen-III C-methyltransferase n=1 Tax=Aromatoleum sp. TaxID=2307007 RepID=UPI0028962B14|nr:uroporphyrinogen-III C-methyltransferase [Aromatoleum sp.]MDT3669603.1 uroporphyrinogen-III C-methyltransferase [Aromatoleum sp.]